VSIASARAESRPTILGFGINDADYVVRKYIHSSGSKKLAWACPFYTSWSNMIKRCYSASHMAKNPCYLGCKVHEEWRLFSAFRDWMDSQEWEGKHLDKDLLVPGNKVYSRHTCVFIEPALNLFICNPATKGPWPTGVVWLKRERKFAACVKNPFNNKRETVAYCDCPDQAHAAWRKRKHELACEYADMQTDARIANALRERFKP